MAMINIISMRKLINLELLNLFTGFLSAPRSCKQVKLEKLKSKKLKILKSLKFKIITHKLNIYHNIILSLNTK